MDLFAAAAWPDRADGAVGSAGVGGPEVSAAGGSAGEGLGWWVRIEGRVYQPKGDSLRRRALVAFLARAAGGRAGLSASRRALFAARAALFMADNKRGRVLRYTVTDSRGMQIDAGLLGHTLANGWFRGDAQVRCVAGAVPERVSVFGERAEEPVAVAPVLAVRDAGIGIACDIDDTIKHTFVWDSRRVLRATLLQPFRAVRGMPELLQRVARAGVAGRADSEVAAMHYVSASPWQLYPALQEFCERASLPRGVMHLRPFRLRAKGIPTLFQDPAAFKLGVLTELLLRWPARRWVLVGDSAEQDAEVAGELARTFPGRLAAVLIRRARVDAARERAIDAVRRDELAGVPSIVFADPGEVDARWLSAALTAPRGPR